MKTITLAIFFACLVAFGCLTYDCLDKFFSCPQGVEISTQPQTSLDFPTISVCPLLGSGQSTANPRAFNTTKLEMCEIDRQSKFKGSSPSCQDPKDAWKDVTPRLVDFGIRNGKVVDSLKETWSLDENNVVLKRLPSAECGVCYSFILPREMRKRTIAAIVINIKRSKRFSFFFHSMGLLNIDPYLTLDYKTMWLNGHSKYHMFVDYQQKTLLDFGGASCIDDETYDYRDCVETQIHKVSVICIYTLQSNVHALANI